MFRSISIKVRLIVAFAIVVLLLVLSNMYAITRLNAVNSETVKLYNHPFTVSVNVLEAETNLIKIHRAIKELILSADDSLHRDIITRVDEYEQVVLGNLTTARTRYLGDKTEIDNLINLIKGWKPIREEVITLIRAGKSAEAAVITNTKGARYVDMLEGRIAKLRRFADGKASEFFTNSRVIAEDAMKLSVVLIVTAFLIGLSAAVYTTRTIIFSIDGLSRLVEKVSQGDLTVQMPEQEREDEIGDLIASFGKMIGNLRVQTKEILEAINVLAASATEISTTATQLATSTSETATSVQETTTTVEEVKQTTQMANEQAQSVSSTARQAVEVGKEGQRAVVQTSEGMDRISEQMESIAESIIHLSEQSQAIGKIITTVEDLSDQSNLLAVNAAIEANKAGEHGKGFVVVAQQIKNMADQSKYATQQVRDILDEIMRATSAAVMATENGSKAVDVGHGLATRAGDAIQTLEQAIDEASQAAVRIEASIGQQSAGVKQVTLAMTNINTAASQNMEGTRQLENSALQLQELGANLKQAIERYKV